MRYLRIAALLGICLGMASFANAQRVFVGVGPGYYGPPPVCAYGYYDYYPYACAPYGYYGPDWFYGGVFIGAGPWFHGFRGFDRDFRGGFRGRGFDHGFRGGFNGRGFDRGFRGGFRGDGGFRGGPTGGFHGGGSFHGGSGFRGGGGGFHGGGGGGFHGGGGHGGGHR